MKDMIKANITGANVEVRVEHYGTYIDGQRLEDIIAKAVGITEDNSKEFRARININIEQVDEGLKIDTIVPEQEPKEEL